MPDGGRREPELSWAPTQQPQQPQRPQEPQARGREWGPVQAIVRARVLLMGLESG
jgi:hypothetical protein